MLLLRSVDQSVDQLISINILATLAPSHVLLPVRVVVGWWIPPIQLLRDAQTILKE